jgi:hypothetical protein
VRACLVILVAVAVLLISTFGSTVTAPTAADVLAAQDVIEAETETQEEETSDDDAARLQAMHGGSSHADLVSRGHAPIDDTTDDAHRRRLFRPPIA